MCDLLGPVRKHDVLRHWVREMRGAGRGLSICWSKNSMMRFRFGNSNMTSLARLAGISEAESRQLIGAIEKRKPIVRWVPSVAAFVVMVAWMAFFGIGTDFLEQTRFDLPGFLHRQGILGHIVALSLGVGIAITLGTVVGVSLRRLLLRRQIQHHLFSPACFWCGYSLAGLNHADQSVRCPECGKASPVALRKPPISSSSSS